MMNDLKITIIVPVYNVERYLERCVESIVNQTYANIEIILVDDGSPDNCPKMCDDWAKRDSRIKVIHKKNGGLGDARNVGLDSMTGELVGFIDSDDWCEPTMFERMLACYEKTRAPIIVCDAFIDWENGWATEYKRFGSKECYSREEMLRAYFQDEIESWMCNKLFEKDLWNTIRFGKQLYEDVPVFRDMIARINTIAFTQTAEYHYIQRKGSIVNAKIHQGHFILLDEMLANVELAKKMMSECTDSCRKSVVVVTFSLLYRSVSQNVFQEKYGDWENMIRQNRDVLPLITEYGAVEKGIINRIACGKRYVCAVRFVASLKKVYFLLKTLRKVKRT